ncbi:methylenetetrahydrofolate reductase C-terminal domain-containing protein [Castellaniella sp. GW247-6E4]|uniref:methylenetetrahydrofolate reductase C-terminal domain-containing protein n=1 Tax=Castellaniella sp. GW247-6E4 TaxID=3140380 RepID=UPI003314C367
MAYRNAIREGLRDGRFLYTLEHVPALLSDGVKALDELARNAELVGRDSRMRGVNIGDRVKSTACFSTVECGKIAAEASGLVPLLHLAGKDRLPAEAVGVIRSALEAGLCNLLLVTGDRVMEPTRPGRTRYHESVVAVRDAKGMDPDCTVATAMSPFKYREEELANQYLKMVKKIGAGTDYLITNCSWDMRKFEELIWYRDARGFDVPIVANLLLPSIGWARGIHSGRLPGVYMSDSLFALITEEYGGGKEKARGFYHRRLAMQVVGVKLMGYAGVQLSGVETYESLSEMIDLVEELEQTITSRDAWDQAWAEINRLPDGGQVVFNPPGGLYMFNGERPAPGSLDALPDLGQVGPSGEEMAKYTRMSRIHQAMFDPDAIGAKVLKPLMRAVNSTQPGKRALLKFEHMTKSAALGCETCGFCRIEHLNYVCPETCPKGLANGPCSGTDDNVCEFKDRECVHNRKYRLAKATGRLKELEEVLVPAVDGTRGTSSWINYYEGTDPKVVRIKPRARKKPKPGS